MTGLNYIFINLLIIFSILSIATIKPRMDYQMHLLVLVITLAIIYNFITLKEGYMDFSQRPRASFDIFCHDNEGNFMCQDDKRPVLDNCQHCDGLCLKGSIGKLNPAEARPLCHQHPLIKNGEGFYKIQSINYPQKYLAYDLKSLDSMGMPLYLAEPTNESEKNLPDLVWKIEKEMDIFRIRTCRQPALYLESNKGGEIGMSYFKNGQWKLLSRKDDEILIQSLNPLYYLTTDGNGVQLNTYLQSWKLVPTKPCLVEGFENQFQFPDTPNQTNKNLDQGYGSMKEWSSYYSQFWNGEYVYKNTTSTNNDYLTVNIHSDGQGTIATKEESWTVRSISPDLLYGDNPRSHIYIEMLTKEKGKEYYDKNLPQIKIITKDKRDGSLNSLVGKNPKNLNAYAPKVGELGQNVQAYPQERFTNMVPFSALKDHIVPLDNKIGYQLPEINLDMKKPCLLDKPDKAPINTGYWSRIDRTERLKREGDIGPMYVKYTYVYNCEDGTQKESDYSPVLRLPTSFSRGGYYYGALVALLANKEVDKIRVYVFGKDDGGYKFNQEVDAKKDRVQVSIIPNKVKEILGRKQCFYGDPTNAPTTQGYHQAFDNTGKIRALNMSVPPPMDVQYSYVYQCEDGSTIESKRSPVLTVKEPNTPSGYYNSIITIEGKKEAHQIKIFAKGYQDSDFILNQTIDGGRDGSIQIYVTPRYLKELLGLK